MLEALRQNSRAHWWVSPAQVAPSDWPTLLATNWRLFACAPLDVKRTEQVKASVRAALSKLLKPYETNHQTSGGPVLRVHLLSGELVAELPVPDDELESADVLWRVAKAEDKSMLELVQGDRIVPYRELVTLRRSDLALLGLERTAMHVALLRRSPNV